MFLVINMPVRFAAKMLLNPDEGTTTDKLFFFALVRRNSKNLSMTASISPSDCTR